MRDFLKTFVFAWLALLGFVVQSYGAGEALEQTANSQVNRLDGEQVVLLHGLTYSSAQMASLETFLKGKGYVVHNLDYPSTKHRIEKLASMIAADLATKIEVDKPVHFIGHSMGGLVVRALLNAYRPDNLGFVLLIGTPSNGTQVADVLKNNWLFEQIYGPAVEQLETNNTSRDALLGIVDYPLGVIAGNISLDPISSMFIPGPDDGTVSVESTKIQGMSDHIIINASHRFLPNNIQTKQQVLHFLRVQSFSR